ncbi:MAG TPA: carbamoyltransferase C-terminal domain-containing protein [Blastocatellia bacterium]|nr:carbamoyltransferase C-terminal domain-containing protein [Blastocatellia bacterium]
MLVLGFHGGHRRVDEDGRDGFSSHDSAAVLVRDGEVLAAIEEERLNRIKHSNCFPSLSIRYCLDRYNLTLNDVDLIANNVEETWQGFYAKSLFLEGRESHIRPDGRGFVASLYEREFGFDVTKKLRFCGHHLAHAWSAYVPSGFTNALILVLDGDGDNLSGMVLQGEGPKLIQLDEFGMDQSLGILYQKLINYLGYHRFDEYKVMGLAPYGDPNVYAKVFEKCYRLLPDGNYSLAGPLTWLANFDNAGLVAAARRKGDPFTQVHKDVAAALQAMLEKIVLHILTHYQKVTKQTNLCLAGGVAHNCTLNGKILYSGLFKHVFVQPAAHDAGGALGAAYSVLSEHLRPLRVMKMDALYFGTDIGDDESIENILKSWGDFISYEKVDQIAVKTAHLLAAGQVVGWAQGRSEFGPRALGNRSILADPRPAENKLLINEMVKKRESYRPFAPSVLEERVRDFFDVPAEQPEYPFMIFVVRTREDRRDILQAVTHVDGTARVHSVSRTTNPLFHEVISEFGKLTGVPVLLNTSFNNNVEPIVNTAEEAIVAYLTTGLNYLAIGSFLVCKKEGDPLPLVCQRLAIRLPRSRRLVQRQSEAERGRVEDVFELGSTASRYFSQPTIRLSREMFSILQKADGRQTLSDLTIQAGILSADRIQKLSAELFELWSKRGVILSPI